MDRRAFLSGVLGAGLACVARRAGAIEAATPIDRMPGPGGALAIVESGRTTFARGCGKRHALHGGACDRDTVFRIGSITKVISGMALLVLRDEGKISLDDPLARLFPELDRDAPARKIALRHLVTHTSGLPRMVPNSISESALVRLLGASPLAADPGMRTSYSNFAMGLVGPIVRRASGVPYREFVRARIFEPLAMKSAAWDARDVDPARLATGHEWNGAARALVPAARQWDMGAAESFGGVYASLDDMVELAREHLAAYGDASAAAPRVLSASSLREMHRAVAPTPAQGERHGVAFFLGDDRVWHDGATDEYSASFVLRPSARAAAIALSNQPDVSAVRAVALRALPRGDA